jgi:hypothetical protein
MIDNIIVRDLVKKLKLFREAVLSINRGGLIKSKLIPPSIREEAAKIFMEHGGLDILMDVLHVSADQIREWSRKLKSDPNYYSKKAAKGIVGGVIKDKKFPKKRNRGKVMNSRDSMLNVLSGGLQEKCEALKQKIEEYKVKNNGSISIELKKEVAEVINEAGNHKAVAILLGLSEKMLAGWKYYYTDKPDITEIFQ